MRKNSLLHHHQVYFSAATIAAHSSYREHGFRPRDVRFFIELFSNWGESPFTDGPLAIQNTQVTRFLAELVRRGHARRMRQSRPERFELSRGGLVELLTRINHHRLSEAPSQFYFAFFFLKNYQHRIETLMHQEGAQFPPHLQQKVGALLDYKDLASRVKRDILARKARIDERIEFAEKSSALVAASKELGLPFPQIAKELERKFPYALNSQKPLSQLLGELPESQRVWEVLHGNLRRVEEIWRPLRASLEQQISLIQSIPSERSQESTILPR